MIPSSKRVAKFIWKPVWHLLPKEYWFLRISCAASSAVQEHSLLCQTVPESDKTLGIVRNPVQRLYFTWRYFDWDKTGPTLEELTRNVYRMYEREKLRELEFHLRPQSEFMSPLAPNTLIKFEEVDEFFAGIGIHLRPKKDNFPAECDKFFTTPQLNRLHTVYREDLELWEGL